MKSLKKAILIASFILSLPSFAYSKNTNDGESHQILCSPYNRIDVAYTNSRLWSNENNDLFLRAAENHIYLNGVALEYIHGFSLSNKYPLFIETGAMLNFGFGTQEVKTITVDTKEIKTDIQNFYLAVPVNLAYRIGVGKDCTLTPYAGLNFKFNLLNRSRLTSVPEIVMGPDGIPMPNGDIRGPWTSLYPSDAESAFGEKYHYQIGWNVGVGMQVKFIYLGVRYGTDFTKFLKDVNSGNFAVSVGYVF